MLSLLSGSRAPHFLLFQLLDSEPVLPRTFHDATFFDLSLKKTLDSDGLALPWRLPWIAFVGQKAVAQ